MSSPDQPQKPLVITMHSQDNVAIVANDFGLAAGTALHGGLILQEHVPQGHKVALQNINKGDVVRRYNVNIGTASHDLPAGAWVNEHCIDMADVPALQGVAVATQNESLTPPLTGYTFEGYRNTDNSVGTRNLLAITTTVQCVSGVVEYAVERIRQELMHKYPNVDGVISLEHSYGCGVAIDAPDARIPIQTVRNISLNPNFGGRAMVVSLGCEKLQPERLMPSGTIPIMDTVQLQDQQHNGFESMVKSIMTTAETHLVELNKRQRTTCPIADLTVGLQCGGSDAFSGVTANPALGYASDLLVRAGATVMFSETTEVRDGAEQLTSRARTPAIAQALVDQLSWYDDYLERGGVDRSANTTPGNKAGGLSNIVEKAMGSIVKSGSAPIDGVIEPGQRIAGKGLYFAATPASDFICGTLQLAAGATLHVFTTGRGTPYSLEAFPVIKVSTRTELAKRWHDLIDFDAGPIATGDASIEELGMQLFEKMIAIASGKQTWAEYHGIRNSLTVFNPAPIT